MNIYRVERRFILQAIGINLAVAGIVLAVTIAVGSATVQLLGLVVVALLFVRAVLLWVRPPTVVRTDAEGISLGGTLGVKRIAVSWTDVQDVSADSHRLYLDRGGDNLLVFPLAYAGDDAEALVRDVRARLDAANGYRRLDGS